MVARMTGKVALAPELAVSRWFNTKEPLTLAGLRGRPVLKHAFQGMPGASAVSRMARRKPEKAHRLFRGIRICR